MFNIYFSYISLGYYLEYTGHFNNFSIADDLKISLDEYNEILKQYRAYEIGGSSYFKRKKDTNKAIKYLETIVIMNKLIGDQNEI